MKSVGAKLEQTTKLAGWSGGPKGELLHQRSLFVSDEGFKAGVEGGEVWVGRY